MNQEAIRTKPRVGNIRDRSREASEGIRRFVEDGIASARLRPSDKLPTERELALQFNAGRNTVRRTLIALETEGRITRHVGRGTFIRSPEPAVTSPANALQTAPREHPLVAAAVARIASPLDLMELRCAWEPNTAALAVQRATPAEIERMQGYIDASFTVESLQDFEDLDDALHRAIAVATRNPLFVAIAEMITTVRNEAEWGMLKKQTVTDSVRQFHARMHSAIVNAIRRREADKAFAAMTEHLREIKRVMFNA